MTKVLFYPLALAPREKKERPLTVVLFTYEVLIDIITNQPEVARRHNYLLMMEYQVLLAGAACRQRSQVRLQ